MNHANLVAGDFDNDDDANVYETSGGNGKLMVHAINQGLSDVPAVRWDGGAGSFARGRTRFVERRNQWTGYVSEAKPTVRIDSGRKYRIHPVHTEKCLDVPGNSVANGAVLDQWDCVTTATWEQFGLDRLGASPYFHIRTAANKCLDVKNWSLLDNATVTQWDCNYLGFSQANQQFRLDYVAGSGWDFVVQLHVAHSDKCLHVSGASTANGAAVVQTTCAGTPPTNRQFILRIEP